MGIKRTLVRVSELYTISGYILLGLGLVWRMYISVACVRRRVDIWCRVLGVEYRVYGVCGALDSKVVCEKSHDSRYRHINN